MRVPLIAGNWKMNKTIGETLNFVSDFLHLLSGQIKEGSFPVEILICPPFTAVPALSAALAGKPVKVGAQDLYWEEKGAFTGEVSPVMLKDAGCNYVIVGHSERRRLFGETNETAAKKIRAAIDHGLRPILCVGETLEERERGLTYQVCESMTEQGLSQISAEKLSSVVIAYEPIWAIGTGKEAKPEDAKDVISHIRKKIDEMFGQDASANVRILYGGSVKSSNIRAFMAQDEIDGALVGGASLDAEEFFKIVIAAKKVKFS